MPRMKISVPDRCLETRILVVDDDELWQALTLTTLRSLGLKADLAYNGAEALAALAQKPYDIVLMDLDMPVMDGLEATRRIRNLANYSSGWPYIIATTCRSGPNVRKTCLDAGMNEYLSKPIWPETLLRLISGRTAAVPAI
jgi:CheY-like chemotaxis protein